MKIRWRRPKGMKSDADVEAARRARELSEQKLAEEEPLKRTLEEMLRVNHVQDDIRAVIRKGHGDSGTIAQGHH